MRALALATLLAVSCAADTPPPGAGTECMTDFPGLRIETDCGATLLIFLNGRQVEPTPRRLDLPGAVVYPWPDWAKEGMPAVASAGSDSVSFTVHPYACEVVELACVPAPDAPVPSKGL